MARSRVSGSDGIWYENALSMLYPLKDKIAHAYDCAWLKRKSISIFPAQSKLHDNLSYVHCPLEYTVHVSMSYLYYYVLFVPVWDDLDAIEPTTVAGPFIGLLIGL
jgi:hypothetical protein